MKRFRDIFIGVLIGCMLMATPVLAESILTKIDVVLNGVNVQLEGKDVEVNSILYNGSTYLPIRKVAELVGKDIEWNQETMTANIIEKTDVKEKEGDNVPNEVNVIKELMYDEFISMFDKMVVLDYVDETTEPNLFIRHYIYNGDLSFEEIKTLLHGQSDVLLQSFAEQIMGTEFDGVGDKNIDGYVILFNYDYIEDSRTGKNTIIQFEQKKGFNNDEINIWKPMGAYEK
ncbi:MAG TPA: hypothetical protein DCS12_05920 [Clostridiales bacterium]|nr:hypothetical protein [Clostridiales bacterium]